MKKSQTRIKLLRAAIVIAFFALILLAILLILKKVLPGFVDVLQEGDQEAIERYIWSFGSFKGAILGFLLQFMQIISIIFPGGPIQLAMGIVFGTWLGFAICVAGYVASNMLVFIASRRLGSQMDRFLPVEKKGVGGFITSSEHPGFMVFLACLLPVLPNGIVPHIAARTKLSCWQFFVSVLFGCMPCLLLLCAAGNRILRGDYLWAGIFGGILVVSIALLYIFREKVIKFVFETRDKLLKYWNEKK